MTEQFDPYYQWLGIRPQEQPPNHYQLLGLRRFEENVETIHNAADRQTAHLRTMQTGEHAVLAQKLLDEVAAAKLCLLMTKERAAYDASLRGEAEEPAFDDSLLNESWLQTAPPSCQKKRQPQKQRPSRQVMVIGLCGSTLLVAVLLWLGRETPTETVSSRSPTQTTVKPVQRPVESSIPPKQTVATAPPPHETPAAPASNVSSAPSTPAPAQAPINEVAPATVPGNKEAVAEAAPPESPKIAPAKPPAPAEKPASKPEKPQEKLPVPSLAVQNEISKQVNELCKDAETAAKKGKSAKELLKLAESSQSADERFVLRRKAVELAGDAGQLALMRQAIDLIAAEFKIDALMVEAKMFSKQTAIDGLDDLLRRTIREDRYDVAMSVVESANRICQKPPATSHRKEVHQKQMEVERLRELCMQATIAMKALENAPDDPLANLTAGQWLWFQKGEVQQGLPHLAKGNDGLLKRLAQWELTEQPTESDSQLKLADAWWEIAQARKGEEKDCFMLHAGEWYDEVNPTLPGGLAKVRIEKRLEEVATLKRSMVKSLVPPPVGTRLKPGGVLPSGRWTDLLALVDVKRDGVGEHWERNGNAIVTKEAAKNATLILPVTVEGDYDLEMQFTRTAGQDTVAIVFLVGSNPCLLTFSESAGIASRLAIDSNLSPPQQENRIRIEPSVLTNGQKYAVVITVRLKGEDVSMQVCLDGKPHLNWSGKQKAVSVEGWPAKQLALGTHEAVTFHSARLRPISGKATLAVPPDRQ